MKNKQKEVGIKYYVRDEYENELKEVLAVYESYTHWYWFITEISGQNGSDLMDGYAFGLVVGAETEWGDIYMPELKNMKTVWEVPKSAWGSISHIIKKEA